MIVDSHCHLDRLKLDKYDGSLSQALESARERGVGRFLCVCISQENRQAVLDIAEQHHDVFASVGIHPCDVGEIVLPSETLQEWAKAEKIVALGESGLDYFHSTERVSEQQQSFINHLEIGKEQGLPVIVHTRNARKDTIELIREHGCRQAAGVLHCFTESLEMAKQALDLNYYISLSGIVTFKNAEELRDVAKYVPMDRLLIETDSPYLAPVPYRGKPNEPSYVRDVANFLADLKGIPLPEFEKATTDNFFSLFNRAA